MKLGWKKVCMGIADKHEKELPYEYAAEYAETMIKLFEVSEPDARKVISYLKGIYHQN